MDFSQILNQRDAKAAAVEVTVRQPGRPVSPTSKRAQGWKSTSLYLRPETRLELQRAAAIIQLTDPPGDWPRDQSEIVQQALDAWLAKHHDKLQRLRYGGSDVRSPGR